MRARFRANRLARWFVVLALLSGCLAPVWVVASPNPEPGWVDAVQPTAASSSPLAREELSPFVPLSCYFPGKYPERQTPSVAPACATGSKSVAPAYLQTSSEGSAAGDTQLVQLERTHATEKGCVGAELAYIHRKADSRYVTNMQKYRMDGGRAEVRYGVDGNLEVGVVARALPVRLFTAPGKPVFPQVDGVGPVVSVVAKQAGQIGDSEWRYAVGGAKSVGNSEGRRYELPDDARATDTIYSLVSHQLADGVEAILGGSYFWLPDATGVPDKSGNSVGIGLEIRPADDWTVGVEGIHETLPKGGRSGVSILPDGARNLVNASVRKAIGGFNIETRVYRLNDSSYRQLDVALSKVF